MSSRIGLFHFISAQGGGCLIPRELKQQFLLLTSLKNFSPIWFGFSMTLKNLASIMSLYKKIQRPYHVCCFFQGGGAGKIIEIQRVYVIAKSLYNPPVLIRD